MRILAIETSCDETACAVVEDGTKILSSVVASSRDMHKKYGGIVPEIAAREQLKCIIPVIIEALSVYSSSDPALRESREVVSNSSRFANALSNNMKNVIDKHIDTIAVTVGPGLIGSLLVGVETAKTIAFVTGKPIIPVNHVLAHMYANFVETQSRHSGLVPESALNKRGSRLGGQDDRITMFPAISLVVSGGHTELYLMKSIKDLMWLGGTLDDAAGECFDKSARLLGFDNGGGAAVEAAASKCQMTNDQCQIKLPRPMIGDESFNFSFSGLKTAIVREWKKHNPPIVPSEVEESLGLSENNSRRRERSLRAPGFAWLGRDDMANAFSFEIQEAITDVLVEKTIRAAKQYSAKSILLSGGVAANTRLREKFKVSSLKFKVSVPPISLCTDNAVYIGSCAFFRGTPTDWHEVTAVPDLSVEAC